MASVDSHPLVVIVGPHCAGKTTLGRRIAAALDWTFDAEVGDQLYAQALADGQPVPDDAAILDAEMARDTDGRRVCESWHVGNLAWAQHRPRKSESAKFDFDAWRQRAETAAVAAMRARPVVFVLVECDESVRLQRRVESGAARLPPFPGLTEQAFVQLTRTVGQEAQRWVEQLCASSGAAAAGVVRVRTDESTVGESVQEALARITDQLLPPPTMPSSPYFVDSCAAALCLLRRAASLDAALRCEVDRCESSLLEELVPVRCGVPVITVDGLDGCGKSTLVESLAGALGGLAAKTPPEALSNLRALVEADASPAMRQFPAEQRMRVKRAFFMMSNYAAIHEAEKQRVARAACTCVVLDRNYLSTAAYTLGVPPTVEDFGELPASAWHWPADLPPPTLALLLRAGQGARQARIQARAGVSGFGVGEWERRISADPRLGERIHSAYLKIEAPGSRIELDAEQDAQSVLRDAIEAYNKVRPTISPLPSLRTDEAAARKARAHPDGARVSPAKYPKSE